MARVFDSTADLSNKNRHWFEMSYVVFVFGLSCLLFVCLGSVIVTQERIGGPKEIP